MNYRWIGKPVIRDDAEEKATGKIKYMTDLVYQDMLWGKIVRSEVPHARIVEIDTTEAERVPGVVAIVTYKDVPGENGYGIAISDQPVFCQDKVRYEGDAVAGVIAETEKIADDAAGKIKVRYELLPIVCDPRLAIQEGAPLVHDRGNILAEYHVQNGNLEKALQEADLVVERNYYCSTQFPVYLEKEGGVAEYKNGCLSMLCGSQYPTQDQRQLSKVLNIPEDMIRIVSNPVGGAFGGKDDLTVQAQLAVMAYRVGRHVKLVNTREESIKTSWKRHPAYITMKTAVKQDGTFLANKVDVIIDTGAYAGLGCAVLTNIMGHACGSYRAQAVDVSAKCVYTNNCPASAMRGFGIPQITFAVESQMDIIAEQLDLDSLEIRIKNGLKTGEKGPYGNTMFMTLGTVPSLQKVKETELWNRREQIKKKASASWKKRGIGIATCIKGAGLGKGIPDYSAAEVMLNEKGEYVVAIGCPDLGQGNRIAFRQMAAEALQCSLSQVKLLQGDSFCTPDSGITAASRSVYTGGNAILLAVEDVKKQICAFATDYWKVPLTEVVFGEYNVACSDKEMSISDLADLVNKKNDNIRAKSYFEMPVADKGVEGVYGLPHVLFGTTTHVVLVEVDVLTGYVDVLQVISIPDAGKIINIQGLEGQAEGGTIMGLGYAIMERGVINQGRILTDSFSTYIIPTAVDCPDIFVKPVEVLDDSGPFGAKGIAEALSTSITPAIINAIYDAVGIRLYELPSTSEKVYTELKKIKRAKC
jgi:CO/xanthine dehydrogenase Mo-binding subunit